MHRITLISPNSFTFLMAFQLVVMVVLGGTGSLTGTILAATTLTVATELLRPVEEAASLFGASLFGASQIIVAVAVLLTRIFRPTGLFGTAEPELLAGLKPFFNRPDPCGGSNP